MQKKKSRLVNFERDPGSYTVNFILDNKDVEGHGVLREYLESGEIDSLYADIEKTLLDKLGLSSDSIVNKVKLGGSVSLATLVLGNLSADDLQNIVDLFGSEGIYSVGGVIGDSGYSWYVDKDGVTRNISEFHGGGVDWDDVVAGRLESSIKVRGNNMQKKKNLKSSISAGVKDSIRKGDIEAVKKAVNMSGGISSDELLYCALDNKQIDISRYLIGIGAVLDWGQRNVLGKKLVSTEWAGDEEWAGFLINEVGIEYPGELSSRKVRSNNICKNLKSGRKVNSSNSDMWAEGGMDGVLVYLIKAGRPLVDFKHYIETGQIANFDGTVNGKSVLELAELEGLDSEIIEYLKGKIEGIGSSRKVRSNNMQKKKVNLKKVNLKNGDVVEDMAVGDGVEADIVTEEAPNADTEIQFDYDALVLYPYSEDGKTSGNISFYKDAGSDLGIMVRVGDGYFEGIAESEYLDMTRDADANTESLITGETVETVIGILKPYMSSITHFEVQAEPDEYVDTEITLIEESRTGKAMVLRYVQSKCVLLPVKAIKASKNDKGYDLFILKNDKYISQGGFSLAASTFAKYGKPKYAVVSKSIPNYFKETGIKSSIDVLINSVLNGLNKDSVSALKSKVAKLEKTLENNKKFYVSKIAKLESQVKSSAVEVSKQAGINSSLKSRVLRADAVNPKVVSKNRSAKALNSNKIKKAF
jgi:hypothetical protein